MRNWKWIIFCGVLYIFAAKAFIANPAFAEFKDSRPAAGKTSLGGRVAGKLEGWFSSWEGLTVKRVDPKLVKAYEAWQDQVAVSENGLISFSTPRHWREVK